METPENLAEALTLERIEVNLFRGVSPDDGPRRIFGGQVIAQSLLAAYGTVEDRVCHSIHCYFIRPGDPTVPIIFEVDRSRDGGSFTTRRVVAIQRGQQIFNLAASFQVAEEGYEHQSTMPQAPRPEDLPTESDLIRAAIEHATPQQKTWMTRPRPIEMRAADGVNRYEAGSARVLEPVSMAWFRARSPIGEDPHMHQVIMAYASDMSLLGTAIGPHGVTWETPGLQAASLDHAMWFHKPSNFNDWHLYVHDSPSASGARGFSRGAIYHQDGTLVASVAQEGLIRMRKG